MIADDKKSLLPKAESESLLEQTVTLALQGVPELKLDEKRKYLGTFKERVIAVLTESEFINEKAELAPKIVKAMKHTQATVILVRGDFVRKLSIYIKYAHKKKLKFKVVSRPDINSDIVLVVAATSAIKNRQ